MIFSDLIDLSAVMSGAQKLPHLLEYLYRRYQESAPQGSATAESFVQWATHFLQTHRVIEGFGDGTNYGFRLTNGDWVILLPPPLPPDATTKTPPSSGEVSPAPQAEPTTASWNSFGGAIPI